MYYTCLNVHSITWLFVDALSMQALRHIQTDYEKRLKDVETQKEQLLDEMESRETTLINKVILSQLFMLLFTHKLSMVHTMQRKNHLYL